jgi:hypothetical protein
LIGAAISTMVEWRVAQVDGRSLLRRQTATRCFAIICARLFLRHTTISFGI